MKLIYHYFSILIMIKLLYKMFNIDKNVIINPSLFLVVNCTIYWPTSKKRSYYFL